MGSVDTAQARCFLPLLELTDVWNFTDGVLRRVCLYERDIGDDGLLSVLYTLERIPHHTKFITEMFLSDTGITDVGMKALAHFIGKNCMPYLAEVDVSDNPTTRIGEWAVRRAMRRVSRIRSGRGILLLV